MIVPLSFKKNFPHKREEKDWDVMKSLSYFINNYGTQSISSMSKVLLSRLAIGESPAK